MSKHDDYVEDLRHKLEGQYDLILTNIPIYALRKRKYCVVGEIDLLAKKGNEYDIYEVKCSFRITKAKLQLRKLRRQAHYNIINSFFYCGNSAQIIAV